jgi:glycosyltransferase involved in cell wall biosynthesis
VRIGVVSPCYDPEEGSAAVAGAICRGLAGLGHRVHVLTGFPNYPTGRIFPGYRLRRYQYEHRDGVHVHRVPLLASHDRSAWRRAATYLSFAVAASCTPRLLRAMDAWLVVCSQATTALPAMVARSLFGRPYVLLLQDLWPQTVAESGFVRRGPMLTAMVRGLQAFCDASYRRAAAVAVTSPGMATALLDRGVRDSALRVVPNWVDESLMRPVRPDPTLAARSGLVGFVVMYAGSLGDLQGLETAVEAVRLLPDIPELRLAFIGSGVAEERLRAAAQGDDRILFLGQRPPANIPALLALGDVQLVSLKDLPLFRATLPSKLQAVLACGRPVLGCVAGDAAAVIEGSGAGLAVPPGDARALAAAIRHMHDLGAPPREAMGRAGRRFYLDHLSARVGAGVLADLLAHAAGGSHDEYRPDRLDRPDNWWHRYLRHDAGGPPARDRLRAGAGTEP